MHNRPWSHTVPKSFATATSSNLDELVESFGMENFNSPEQRRKPKGGFTMAPEPLRPTPIWILPFNK
jgi:hypothetical protein